MNNITLREINIRTRLYLHALTATAVVFLSFYGKVVCPFIDTLTLGRIMAGLGSVFVLQILMREGFYYYFPQSSWRITLARHGYYISVVTWLLAGVVASLLHDFLYSDFHWTSHLKLLSGYWGLGAGILSQLEYVILENVLRQKQPTVPRLILERITGRLMESFSVFILVPVMMMVLVSFRFVYEGFTQREAALEVLFLGLCFVLAGLFISWMYGRSLRKDCDHLLEAVRSVSQGKFHLEVDASRGDELGRVADGINEMAQGLLLRERIREAFGRFVNPEVAETFIDNFAKGNRTVEMGGQRREVAILMADIRDFTPLSETMDPEELTRLLNGYFSEMVAAVQTHRGMVDKFMGDAIMAVFGLSEGPENCARDAVLAALEMQERLLQWNKQREKIGKSSIQNGIGIHVGEVVAGYIGSADRLEFTVIGHAVNLAARIESQSKFPNPSLLLSHTVVERLPQQFKIQEVTTSELKGISGKTPLYTVTL